MKNKVSDSSDSNDFKEGMISSNFFKLLEYVIMSELKMCGNLSRSHFGFRQKSSTLDAIIAPKEVSVNYINDVSTVYVCFIDLSKSFDCIDHQKLLNKLHEMNLPGKFFILRRRKSETYNQLVGASLKRRGTGRCALCLSPQYFFLFQFWQASPVTKMASIQGLKKINRPAYADDIVIFRATSSGLPELINVLTEQCNEHELAINYDKTETLKFFSHDDPVFMVNNITIENLNQYKSLCVKITSDLSITRAVERVQNILIQNVGMLNRPFNSFNLDVKLMLFKTICWTKYGLKLWSSRKKKRKVH